MRHEKGKPETKKEVRNMSKEQQRLIKGLNEYGELANDTKHTRKFRQQRLSKMIQYITMFINDNPAILLKDDERYILLSLIKGVSYFQIEKSADNKEAIEGSLESYEAIVEKTEGEKIKGV